MTRNEIIILVLVILANTIVGSVFFWPNFLITDSDMILRIMLSIFISLFVFITFYSNFGGEQRELLRDFTLVISLLLLIPGFIITYAGLYAELGLEPIKATENRWDTLYFSIVTFTTLGYGDIKPAEEARLFASSEALIGFLFVPVIIAQLLNVMYSNRSSAVDIVQNAIRSTLIDMGKIEKYFELSGDMDNQLHDKKENGSEDE